MASQKNPPKCSTSDNELTLCRLTKSGTQPSAAVGLAFELHALRELMVLVSELESDSDLDDEFVKSSWLLRCSYVDVGGVSSACCDVTAVAAVIAVGIRFSRDSEILCCNEVDPKPLGP